jgi:hypothetical protein
MQNFFTHKIGQELVSILTYDKGNLSENGFCDKDLLANRLYFNSSPPSSMRLCSCLPSNELKPETDVLIELGDFIGNACATNLRTSQIKDWSMRTKGTEKLCLGHQSPIK